MIRSCRRQVRAFASCALAAVAVVASLLPMPSGAAVFSIAPLRMNFGPRERAVAVTISNPGDTPVALEAQVFSWSQRADGTDDLKFTDDLILAPPIVRLAPRSQQVVRLAFLRPPDPQRQLSYRMIVREMAEGNPVPPTGVSVPFSLALNLPVFVTPASARWQVGCGVERHGARLRAVCENTGNAFALIRELRVERSGAVLGRFEGGAYILPGVKRFVDLESGSTPTPGAGRLIAVFEDDQRLEEDVVLQ